jgi:hypothetical protein
MRIIRFLFTAVKASFLFLINAIVFFFVPDDEDQLQGSPPNGRRLDEGAEFIGEYNFRTGKMDLGTDPAGWYEDER